MTAPRPPVGGGPVRLGPRIVGDPVRTPWDQTDEAPAPTVLDDLGDVEVARDDVGVLTRTSPGGVARFAPLPEPVRPERHTQTAAADRWQIVHNLGYRPHFDVRDTDGRLHMPENVEHPVPGVISEIVLCVPMPGTADPS